jgi:carbonic anhydrase/acetyltransferase-like protein (isoleucine patch superfamily)
MGAVVLQRARVGTGSVVAAGSVVAEGAAGQRDLLILLRQLASITFFGEIRQYP